MQSAKNLRVYQAAETLAVRVHRVVRSLRSDERYALGQQMRRSAISVGSNIAEGCGRGGNVELARFLRIALGSAMELDFQLTIARKLEFLDTVQVQPAQESCVAVQRMLIRLIGVIRPATKHPETSREPKTANRKRSVTPNSSRAHGRDSHDADGTAPSP